MDRALGAGVFLLKNTKILINHCS